MNEEMLIANPVLPVAVVKRKEAGLYLLGASQQGEPIYKPVRPHRNCEDFSRLRHNDLVVLDYIIEEYCKARGCALAEVHLPQRKELQNVYLGFYPHRHQMPFTEAELLYMAMPNEFRKAAPDMLPEVKEFFAKLWLHEDVDETARLIEFATAAVAIVRQDCKSLCPTQRTLLYRHPLWTYWKELPPEKRDALVETMTLRRSGLESADPMEFFGTIRYSLTHTVAEHVWLKATLAGDLEPVLVKATA